MNNKRNGFSLIELLVACTILLIMMGGICCIILALPRIAYSHVSSFLACQQNADFWFLLNKDIKNAGYGLLRIPSLATFPLLTITNGDDDKNTCAIFWNKDDAAAYLLKRAVLSSHTLIISATDNIQERNLALLAENDPISGDPHWALIRVTGITPVNESMLKISYVLVSQGPEQNYVEFHELAYFLKVEKILYFFSPDSKKIERMINDEVFQPVVEHVDKNDFGYCRGTGGFAKRNCIETNIVFQSCPDRKENFIHVIYAPNIDY